MGPSSVLDLIPDTPVEGNYLINYSVAKVGGKLVAYRWDGEQIINKDKFILVDRTNNT